MDASITAFSHALRLLGSGLRVAHRVKCRKSGEEFALPGLCQRLQNLNIVEWQEFIRRSSSFARSIDNPSSVGIHVGMELPTYYDLYAINTITAKLEKVTQVQYYLFVHDL